ncbi:MAG: HAD family hydrolase [Planctomycetota bacterium]
MPRTKEALRDAQAVVFSWHGVLFDRDRRAIHGAVRATFARWGVALSEQDLLASRGPTARAQIVRLFSNGRVAEEFRARHARWPTPDDLDAMERDLAPRLLEAATQAAEPNADAVQSIRRLRERGVRTAAIACLPKHLLAPQFERLMACGGAPDVVVTTDESCDPAPAPWAIFDAMRQLGVNDSSRVLAVDDSPAGAAAAANAGAQAIALEVAGGALSPQAIGTVRSLDDIS